MRKKKDEKPIVLSNQELMPSVLGVISDKGKSFWPIIFFFLFLIGFIFALPMVSDYLSGKQPIVLNPGSSEPSQEPDHPVEPTPEIQYYEYQEGLTIPVGGMSFSNFAIDRRVFSFQIFNQSEVKNYLVQHRMYLELYDQNQTLLQRIKLPNENISVGDNLYYEFDLTVATKDIYYLVVSEKNPSDYPSVNIQKDENDTYLLTCAKDTRNLHYSFDKDLHLSRIEDIDNFSTARADYSDLLFEYRQQSGRYNAIDGLASNVAETSTGFTVTTIIDLNQVDMNNTSIRNTLDDEVYYGKGTEGKVVYFELSAMGYQCS